MTQVILLKTL